MQWKACYSDAVLKHDIPQLDATIRKRIRSAIEHKLCIDPFHFGKPLRYNLSHQRSLRVGDYRILYQIETIAQ